MITSFEVGAIFRIVNEASPTLTRILRQVRDLNAAIERARLSLAELGKGNMLPAGLTAAVGETNDLALAWKNVAKNAAEARATMGATSTTALRTAAANAVGGPRPPSGAGGGALPPRGGGRHRPGWLGGGDSGGIYGPSVAIPGGSHAHFYGGAAAAAGLLGYGAYEAAEMQDAVFQIIYHSGLPQNDDSRSRFRKVIQDAMAESGYGLKDIAEAAKQEIRMFQGTPGGGLEVLPEMLRASTIESRLKGSSPKEAMQALIGLAHMTKQYDPAAIKKLAPTFAFLSTANPASLSSIERAAGYAVPLLQSGLEIDPLQTLLLGTALTRAGATNTKSGTWLREMAIRAMPGTSLMTKIMFKKHEAALRELGLVDKHDKPTWFTGGKPDLLKMLDIAGANAPKIPITRRAALERALFGAQGGGGFALLADPAVRGQVQNLRSTMESPEFQNRYRGFMQAYNEGSTVQQARTALAAFNNTMMDLGAHTLPAVTEALRGLKSILEGIRSVLPSAIGVSGAKVGGAALLGAGGGAAVGAVTGAFGGPVGAFGGAVIGAGAGAAYGLAPTPNQARDALADSFVDFWKKSEDQAKESLLKKGADILRDSEAGAFAAPLRSAPSPSQPTLPPISLSLNIDGKTLAQTIADKLSDLYRYDTNSPAFNGSNLYGP